MFQYLVNIITRSTVFYGILLFIVASVVFSIRFDQPAALFWDENYHIASAEKYQQGVFFLEPHPPLGKMILAASNAVFSINKDIDTSAFIKTDKIDSVPDNFSFIGLRLPSIIAAIICVLLLYCIGLIITKNAHASFVAACLLMFDNAFIVHSRGAMLESIQLVFILASILATTFMVIKSKFTWKLQTLLALFIGLAVSVKINSLILICLIFTAFIASIVHQYLHQKRGINTSKIVHFLSLIIEPSIKFFYAICVIILTFVTVQGMHAAVAHTPYQGRLYETSIEYQEFLEKEPWYSPKIWIATTVEWYNYNNNYQKGVPSYKPGNVEENGSLPWMWLAGGKTIAYRWGKLAENIKTGQYLTWDEYQQLELTNKTEYKQIAQYLYLVPNFVSWFISLFSIISLFGLLGVLLYQQKMKFFTNPFHLLAVTIVTMWAGYLAAVSFIPRVMYLYHYFIPLTFGFIAFLCVLRIFSNFYSKQTELFLSFLLVVIVMVFLWYAPFTYFIPLSKNDVDMRNFFPIWQLKSVVE